MSTHEDYERELRRFEFYGHPRCGHMPFFGPLAPLKCPCCPHNIYTGCKPCLERKKRVLLLKSFQYFFAKGDAAELLYSHVHYF